MSETAMLRHLFKAKAWANDAMLTAMQQLDPTSPATEIAIRILSHTYVVDQIFAANLQRQSHAYTSANTIDAPALAELAGNIRKSDQWYIDYVAGLDGDQRAERIDFTFTDGAPGRMSREEMLMHLITHGGYHRGQIGWIMTLNGVDPSVDGLTTYLHQAEAATRRRGDAPGEPAVSIAPAPPAMETQPVSRLERLTERMQAALSAGEELGKTLKFDLKGEGFVFIDGKSVGNEDKPADLTLTVSIDDLRAIGQGKLALMSALMSGRLRVSNMGLAAALKDKMKTLFATMT